MTARASSLRVPRQPRTPVVRRAMPGAGRVHAIERPQSGRLGGPRHDVCGRLIDRYGGRYSTELGLRLAANRHREIFQWFLAAVLFGAPIRATAAAATYRALQGAGIDSPRAVIATGWNGLVTLLDEGGYARYDYKTATKLLEVCGAIQERYRGSLAALHAAASDSADLEARLLALGTGIGPVTANIFLREMRGIWPKAQPLPLPIVIHAAHHLGAVPVRVSAPAAVLDALQRLWDRHPAAGRDFADFEAALVRAGLDLQHRLGDFSKPE